MFKAVGCEQGAGKDDAEDCVPTSQELTDWATHRAPGSQREVKAKHVTVSYFPFPFPFRPRQQRVGKGVLAHPSPQCQINQVKLKLQASHRVWKKDQTTIIGRFCTAPLPVNDK